MNEEFKKGVSVGLTIYLVFAVIAIVTHLITGWDYPHGPPISFGVIMIAAVVGMIRFFTNLWRITSDNKKDRAKGGTCSRRTFWAYPCSISFAITYVVCGLYKP